MREGTFLLVAQFQFGLCIELLPIWLLAVVVAVGTILIMLVVVGVVIALCMRCRHRASKPLHSAVNIPSMSTLSASENGM